MNPDEYGVVATFTCRADGVQTIFVHSKNVLSEMVINDSKLLVVSSNIPSLQMSAGLVHHPKPQLYLTSWNLKLKCDLQLYVPFKRTSRGRPTWHIQRIALFHMIDKSRKPVTRDILPHYLFNM
jgi:hypothetical protein